MQLCELVHEVVTMEEVVDFFVDTWAPTTSQLHTAGGGHGETSTELAGFLKDLLHCQRYHTDVFPACTHTGIIYFYVHM